MTRSGHRPGGKHFLPCLLIALAFTTAAATTSAADPTAILVGDTAMVPLRATFEWLGASVQYEDGRILASKGSTSVALTVGSRDAVINGETTSLTQSPLIRDGSAYIPLRFVAESFGAGVSYDAAARQVIVTDDGRSWTIPVANSDADAGQPQAPPDQAARRPAFVRGNQICVGSLTGGEPSVVCAFEGEFFDAQTSVDGRFTMFSAGPDEQRSICSVDVATGETKFITYASSFSLSPDELTVAVSRPDPYGEIGDYTVTLLDVTSGVEPPLLQSSGDFPRDYGPYVAGWSADGDLVFLHGHNGTETSDTVVAVDAATGLVRWSTGGSYCFTAGDYAITIQQQFKPEMGKDHYLFRVPLRSDGARERLTDTDYGMSVYWHSERSPALSPDGSILAFVDDSPADDGEHHQNRLRTLHLITGECQTVASLPETIDSLWPMYWSPDGRKLLFTGTSLEDTRMDSVWVVGSDGQGLQCISGEGIALGWVR